MWTVQYISTAIVLLLINAKYTLVKLPEGSPILAGKFDDFSVEWYGVVGGTIVLSCFINAVMPLFNFVFLLQAGLKRCIDRGCSCDKRRTKKILQSDYEQLYMGSLL
jgi:hypothetical protein